MCVHAVRGIPVAIDYQAVVWWRIFCTPAQLMGGLQMESCVHS